MQTRLTAEQFYDAHREFEHVPTLARKHFFEFAEAFRDKSEAELRAKLAEQEKERDLYALLRGICEEVIDWLGALSYDGIDDAKSVLDHPLSKDIRLKLQQMYDHPLDNKLLIRTDVLEAKLERAQTAEAEAAALRERERWMRVPNEQAWWWHWDAEDYHVPHIYSVMVSKTGPDRYFVANGAGTWCDEMGGFWLKVGYPNVPSRDEQKALSAAPERGKDGKS